MTKTKKILLSAIVTASILLVACFAMMSVERNVINKDDKNIKLDNQVLASGYVLNDNMTADDYKYNSVFYIDDDNGVATFEKWTNDGYNFFNKEVFLTADIDLYDFFYSFGNFVGVFNGGNHVLYNFRTSGLFSTLGYADVASYFSDAKYVYKKYIDDEGYCCVMQNLYINCVTFENDCYGEVSPFIGKITNNFSQISIKNCGVKGIEVPLKKYNNHIRDSLTIAGFVSSVVGYRYTSYIKFEDCYIDSRVWYVFSNEYYTTTDPIDYIMGPMTIAGGVAWTLEIINCCCLNITDQNIPWTIIAHPTITDSYQHEKDIPRDHDIFKATSKGGTWEDVGEKWYQYEWFNDGHPIPRPFTTWLEIGFEAIDEPNNHIKEITPELIFIPSVYRINRFDTRYANYIMFDGHNGEGIGVLRDYEGTSPSLNFVGHTIVTVPQPSYIIKGIYWSLQIDNVYVVSITAEKTYMMLKIYHTDDKVNTLITLPNGNTVVYNQPNGSTPIKEYIIKSGDHFTITELKKFRNEEVCITKNYGTGSTQEIYVNLIKTVTFTVPYYQEKTYKLLGELKITFTVKEEYSNSYSLCNIFEDENVDWNGYRKVSLVDTRLVSGNMSIGMISEIKKYSVIISGNEE